MTHAPLTAPVEMDCHGLYEQPLSLWDACQCSMGRSACASDACRHLTPNPSRSLSFGIGAGSLHTAIDPPFYQLPWRNELHCRSYLVHRCLAYSIC